MIVKKNCFLVEVQDKYEFPLGMRVDVKWTDERHIFKNHIGKIIGLPIRIDNKYFNEFPLVIGDDVFMSHLVCEDKYRVSHNVFYAEYFHLFAKVAGAICPLDEFILLERGYREQHELLKVADKQSGVFGYAKYLSEYAIQAGVKVGDKVFFTHNANYEFNVQGALYTRIRIRNVVGVERDGELICLNNRALVHPEPSFENVSGLIFEKKETQRTAVVLKSNIASVKPNDKVAFYNDVASRCIWRNKEYAFLNEENIKFVWN